MKAFQYQALEDGPEQDRIRLLELFPGQRSDELRCRLKPASLSTNPRYEALSYCWASPSTTAQVICDGAELSVTQSLYSALHGLRRADQLKTLWVDAICINQADSVERNAQVQRMRSIYSRAERVLIWLGEPGENSDLAMWLIKRLGQEVGTTNNPMLSLRGAGILSLEHPAWGALAAMWQRPYFRRAWVLQEVAVAQAAMIFWGSASVAWEEFWHAMAFTMKSGIAFQFDPLGGMRFVEGMHMARQELGDHLSLPPLSFLLRYRMRLASDDRDKIYAYFGFVEDRLRELSFEVDYALKVKDVYIRFAVALIQKQCNLDFLTVPRGPERSNIEGLPSWVPDWSQSTIAASLLRLEVDSEPAPFRAGGDLTSPPLLDSERNRLGLEGAIVDEIRVASRVITIYGTGVPGNFTYMSWLRAMRRVNRNTQSLLIELERVAQARTGRAYFTGETMLDVYWQCLRGGATPEGSNAAREAFYKWDRSRSIFRVLHPLDIVLQVYSLYFIFLTTFTVLWGFLGFDRPLIMGHMDFLLRTSAAWNRRMIRTKGEYVGLAPSLCVTGDKIAIVKGYRCPIAIRRKDDVWEFLGDCYIHGIMKGELSSVMPERIWLT